MKLWSHALNACNLLKFFITYDIQLASENLSRASYGFISTLTNVVRKLSFCWK
jgi:hypothetical protein